MRLVFSLLLLCGVLVGEAEGFFSRKPKRVTIDLLKDKCFSLFWSSCRSCSGKCVRGKTAHCKKAPCASNPCGKDEKCVNNYCGGCHACCVKKPFCSSGHRTCVDGSKVHRDPEKGCAFPPCKCPPEGWSRVATGWKCWFLRPKCKPGHQRWSHSSCGCGCKPVVCGKDVRTCPGGSTVARDPNNYCKFPSCPCPPKGWTRTGNIFKCLFFKPKCGAGYERWSHSSCGCGCKPVVCPKDSKTCPDGSTVVRDPKNYCKFPRCKCPPKGWSRFGNPEKCKKTKPSCKPGYKHWAHEECGCGCKPVVCDKDEKKCPDGSIVTRDPKNYCRFPPCKCPPKGWTHFGNPEKCKKHQYACKPGYKPWSHDECGCGCKPVVCDKDEKKCPDGSTVVRDPKNYCKFPRCECPPKGWSRFGNPEKCKKTKPSCRPGYKHWSHDECGCGCKPVECDKDEKKCPDGSTVARNPKDDCNFPPCKCPPEGWTHFGNPEKCKKHQYACKPGYKLWSHDECGCGCKPIVCPEDEKTCPDGTVVLRDPANYCRFPPCKCPPKGWTRVGDPEKCKTAKYACKPGYEHWSHHECGCGCKPVECDKDEKKCPDGSVFVRDPEKDCKFPECKPVGCPSDVKKCPDGSTVERDAEKGCEFPECECPPKGWTKEGTPEECKTKRVKCGSGQERWSHEECGCGCKPRPCREGQRTCPDGSVIVRDINDRCRWQKCNCRPRGWTNVGGPRKCETHEYACKPGYEKWSHSSCGCGCKPAAA